MRIEQLKYVVEISKHKTLSDAAGVLHLTAQTLSRSVTTIEDEAGFKILERSYQGVRFTDDGKIFLEMAKRILQEYESTITHLQNRQLFNQKELLQGTLQVFSHHVFITSILPSVVSGFCMENPKIEIELEEGNFDYIFQRWVDEKMKGGATQNRVGLFSINPNDLDQLQEKCMRNGMVFQPVFTRSYCVCVSTTSPLAKQKTITINTLLKYPLIRFSSDVQKGENNLTKLLKQYGVPRYVFSTSSVVPWVHAVSKNLGLGVISDIVLHEDSLVKDEFSKVIVLRLKNKLERLTGLLYDGDATAITKEFVAYFPRY